MSQSSELEALLEFQLRAAKLDKLFVREYAAIEGRKWRWDFCCPRARLLIECNGQIWHKGGHSSGRGLTRDAEKLNAATLAGFRSLVFTREMIESGEALRTIEQALTATY